MKKKLNWATSEEYAKAFEYIEQSGGNVENTYLYKDLLEANGFVVYVKDLKDWLSAQLDTNKVSVSGFKL